MKKIVSIIPLLCVLAVIYVASTLISCKKEEVVTPTEEQSTLTARQTQDWRNPDPTWIQVTSPILRPARWGGYVFAGFTAGLPGLYSDQKFQIYDTTVVIKWHLHVGLRSASGGKWKPDVIDYRFFYINGNGQKFVKTIPNGGVQGEYDFVDTVKIDNWGYYNWMYDPSMGNGGVENLLYDWNGITPTIHSAATNGWLDDPLMTKYLRP